MGWYTKKEIIVTGANTVPPTFYHGTPSALLKSIQRVGLQNPFLCDSEDKAHYYAEEAAAQHKGNPVILRVSVSNTNRLRYDGAAMDEPVMADEEARDDAWNFAAKEHPEWVKGGIIVIPSNQWEISWHAVGSVWYEGVIPWKNIKMAISSGWYKKAISQFERNRREDAKRRREYYLPWKYPIDDKPSQEMLSVFEKARNDILQSNILKNAKAPFKNFVLHYTKNIRSRSGLLARYLSGSYSEPVVIVDLKAHEKAREEYGVEPYIAARSSILHELKHAMQEAAGAKEDEAEAEDFAHKNTMSE